MDNHTFKVGDLVTCHDVTSLCPDGTKAVVVDVKNGYGGVQIWVKSLDERFRDVNGYFSEKEVHSYLKHDTDFQVGDWVRYEAVDKFATQTDGKIGEVKRVSGYSFLITWEGEDRLRDHAANYLVKIQPPQEEKKMVIQEISSNQRRVHDVVESVFMGKTGWIRGAYNRVIFYPSTHWEPVEEWVKIEVRKPQWETINTQIGTLEAWGLDGNCHTVIWRPVK